MFHRRDAQIASQTQIETASRYNIPCKVDSKFFMTHTKYQAREVLMMKKLYRVLPKDLVIMPKERKSCSHHTLVLASLGPEEKNTGATLLSPDKFTFVGIAQSTAEIHPEAGETILTVMIAGMITIRNGEDDLCTGDPLAVKMTPYYPVEGQPKLRIKEGGFHICRFNYDDCKDVPYPIGRALSNAKPGEMIDIQLSTLCI
jgi:hypothetical protein